MSAINSSLYSSSGEDGFKSSKLPQGPPLALKEKINKILLDAHPSISPNQRENLVNYWDNVANGLQKKISKEDNFENYFYLLEDAIRTGGEEECSPSKMASQIHDEAEVEKAIKQLDKELQSGFPATAEAIEKHFSHVLEMIHNLPFHKEKLSIARYNQLVNKARLQQLMNNNVLLRGSVTEELLFTKLHEENLTSLDMGKVVNKLKRYLKEYDEKVDISLLNPKEFNDQIIKHLKEERLKIILKGIRYPKGSLVRAPFIIKLNEQMRERLWNTLQPKLDGLREYVAKEIPKANKFTMLSLDLFIELFNEKFNSIFFFSGEFDDYISYKNDKIDKDELNDYYNVSLLQLEAAIESYRLDLQNINLLIGMNFFPMFKTLLCSGDQKAFVCTKHMSG